jgi:hypothetical protein
VLWDLGEHHRRLEPLDALATADDDTTVPCLRYIVVSAIEAGHKSCVTDLTWLPPCMEVRARPSSCVELVTFFSPFLQRWILKTKKGYKAIRNAHRGT